MYEDAQRVSAAFSQMYQSFWGSNRSQTCRTHKGDGLAPVLGGNLKTEGALKHGETRCPSVGRPD
ncbi:hypothetical protein AOE01nite_24140 [Acetobacter oeni]|uniref:Uncharacterized protein n=1 Tax=Acetobacter oeni TaxID=304077 RepID=A0A511XMM9_9PROT|nr:hypothetical protein AA21952_0066 [Acetobacter oeni LMG 21952]GEN64190.1 hypothetical protein AOE01nite_24140 [Acetobacter oeni]